MSIKTTKTTLLFLTRGGGETLLARKKRKFGEGKFNGIGGKLEADETFEQAMIRETQEEIEVTPVEYEKFGEITFLEFINSEQEQVIMHLYKCWQWDGEPTETEEMAPQWFKNDAIPLDNMFPDDAYWFPLFLDGKKFRANFEFDENWDMVSHEIIEVDSI